MSGTSGNNLTTTVSLLSDMAMEAFEQSSAHIANFNHKYENFRKVPNSFGSQVLVARPTRVTSGPGLSLPDSTPPWTQEYYNLVISNSWHSEIANTTYQDMFYEEQIDWITDKAFATVETLRGKVESQMCKLWDSTMQGAQSQTDTGAPLYTPPQIESGPFRFYANWTPGATTVDAINDQRLIKKASNLMKVGGVPGGAVKAFIHRMVEHSLLSTFGQDFLPTTNDKYYDSWMLREWAGLKFYSTDFLPIHYSGTIANNGETLTIVEVQDSLTVDPMLAALSVYNSENLNKTVQTSTLVCTDASSGGTVNVGDLIQINSVVSKSTVVTYNSKDVTSLPVQVRVVAVAEADGGGDIEIVVYPRLISDPNSAIQNISAPLQAGDLLNIVPDHLCGGLAFGDSGHFVNPPLKPVSPWDCKVNTKNDLSLRTYSGNVFRKDIESIVTDTMFAGFIDPWASQRICFAPSQAAS